MKELKPELVLDPMWLCQANYVDLEYYTYVLLSARKKYLENLDKGFHNFYEIFFHYINLNTVIADKKLYDSHLEVTRSHKNLLMIVPQLSQRDETMGKEIVKMASSIFAEVMHKYLSKQLSVFDGLHFHFNNQFVHKQGEIYIVRRFVGNDNYEIMKLSISERLPLGNSLSDPIVVNLPDLKHSEFKQRLVEHHPQLSDFDPSRNVILVSGNSISPRDLVVCLIKDTILMNRVVNPKYGFDANVMLDCNRLLEKRQAIPFKIKQ